MSPSSAFRRLQLEPARSASLPFAPTGNQIKPTMLALAGTMIALTTCAMAQDRRQCSAKCGGRPAGEANPPPVMLCISKCVGATGASDSVGKKTFK